MNTLKNAFFTYFYDSPNLYHRVYKIGILIVPIYLIFINCIIYLINLIYELNQPAYFELQHQQHVPFWAFDIFFIFIIPIISTLIFQKWTFEGLIWIFNKMGFEATLGEAFVLNLSSNMVICIFSLLSDYDNFLIPVLRLPFCILLTWIYVSHWMEFENKWKAYWITCGTFILKNAWIVGLNYFFAFVF